MSQRNLIVIRQMGIGDLVILIANILNGILFSRGLIVIRNLELIIQS